MASIYKRGRYWWVSWLDQGRRRAQSLKVGDKKEAKNLLKFYESRENSGFLRGTPIPAAIGIREWGEEYRRRRVGRVSPNTIKKDKAAWDSLIASTGFALDLRDLTRSHLEVWYSGLLEGGRAVATANALLRHVRACLQSAVDSDYLHRSPATGIKPGREVKEPIRILSTDEVSALLESIDADQHTAWGDLVRMGLYTGARLGELTRLEVQDFDPGCRSVVIRSTSASPTKSGKSRTVPLPSAGLPFFHRLISSAVDDGRSLLLVNPSGDPWAVCWVSRAFTKIAKGAGVDCTFHDLRRTYGARLVELGSDLITVQKNLGHSSITVTVEHYADMQDAHRQEQVDRLSAL